MPSHKIESGYKPNYLVFIRPEKDGSFRLYVDAGAGVNPAGDRFHKSEEHCRWPAGIKFTHATSEESVKDARRLQAYLDSLK